MSDTSNEPTQEGSPSLPPLPGDQAPPQHGPPPQHPTPAPQHPTPPPQHPTPPPEHAQHTPPAGQLTPPPMPPPPVTYPPPGQYSPDSGVAGWQPPPTQPTGGSSKGVIIGVVAGIVMLALVAVVVVVAFSVGGNDDTEQADSEAPDVEAPDVESVDAGLVHGDGPVQVDIYLDYSCDHCATFEETHADRLAGEVGAGAITITYHPLALLDSYSADNYSTRAAAASACAAAEGRFIEYSHELLANYPDMTATHSNADLADFGSKLLFSDAFTDCVTGGTYLDWAGDVSDQASAEGVASIPYVLIDGAPLSDAIADFESSLDDAVLG